MQLDYHDVLAIVGAAAAHPGGNATTRLWQAQLHLEPTNRVLDIGCGTGKTLVDLIQQTGCEGTGIDNRPAMIRKAQMRAKHARVSATWLVGSAESLPLPDEIFHLAYTESVNVFVDVRQSLRQYHRVLRPDGIYVDVEMMVMGPVTPAFHASARQVYGAHQVPDLRGWKTLYRDAGFGPIRVVGTYPVRPDAAFLATTDNQNPSELADSDAYRDPHVLRILRQNATWLEQNHRSLAYGIFICQKEH